MLVKEHCLVSIIPTPIVYPVQLHRFTGRGGTYAGIRTNMDLVSISAEG